MGTTKVELFSDEWLELAREYLEGAVAEAGASLEGVRFALCEVLTDAPAHLTEPDTTTVSWHAVFDGPTVKVGRGEIDCPFKLTSDYESVVPRAKIVYADDPVALAATREHRADDLPPIPPELGDLLVGLHDFLARRTA